MTTSRSHDVFEKRYFLGFLAQIDRLYGDLKQHLVMAVRR